MHDTLERRIEILQILSIRRFEVINNLAFEFSVHVNTIKNDISQLSHTFPIYTVQGNGGGIYVMDNWYFGKQYFSEEQVLFFQKILPRLDNSEQEYLIILLQKFTKPKIIKK